MTSRGFVDLGDGDDFADTLGGLHVDDAFAAAVGEAVFVGGGALAESVFGDGEDQRAFDGDVDRLRGSPSTCAFALGSGAADGRCAGLGVVAMPTT